MGSIVHDASHILLVKIMIGDARRGEKTEHEEMRNQAREKCEKTLNGRKELVV